MRSIRFGVTVSRTENYMVVGPPPYISLYIKTFNDD